MGRKESTRTDAAAEIVRHGHGWGTIERKLPDVTRKQPSDQRGVEAACLFKITAQIENNISRIA